MAHVSLKDMHGNVVTVDDGLRDDVDKAVKVAREELQILQGKDPAA